MKSKIWGVISICVGILLILSSAGFMVYNLWDETRAAEKAARTTQILCEIIDAQEQQDTSSAAQEDETEPGIVIDGETYIAVLGIPPLGLELPVNKHWSYSKLSESPCRYSGSIGNSLVIAAHNYKNHFGDIAKLSRGDTVTLTDVEGRRYLYSAEEVTTLGATSIDEMVNSGYDLTLFTCNYSGSVRVTVRCKQN